MDWGTVGILAGVVTLEGFRRLPVGAVVLRRSLFGVWGVAASGIERGRWALVAWWPPLFCTVLLPPRDGSRLPTVDLEAMLGQARPWRVTLDVLGALVLLALLAALPVAMTRFGSGGFLLGLALMFGLAAATSAVGARARAALGLPWRPALAALSPFAAPHAAERLLEDLLGQAPRLTAVRMLLPGRQFSAWIRRAAYDSAHGSPADPELAGALTAELRAQVLAPPPRTPDAERYCPRCGGSYHRGEFCGNCEGIALLPFPS